MAKKIDNATRDLIESLLRQREGQPGIDKIVADEVGVTPLTISRFRKKLGIKAGKRGRPTREEKAEVLSRPMNELSRGERIDILRRKMSTQSKYKMLTQMFSPEETELFLEEFGSIVEDIDALDPVEEQHLYMMITTFVLATRNSIEYRRQLSEYEIDPDNAKKPEANIMTECMRTIDQYNKYKSLFVKNQMDKRERVAKQGKSFLDFNEIFAHQDKQKEAMRDILSLKHKQDEELKRMIQSGELKGFFDV